MSNLNIKIKKVIEDSDWDKLVVEVYNRPYSFQQQEGCKSRGVFDITIPSEDEEDNEMNDFIPEIINSDKIGVKFKSWLERDPTIPLKDNDDIFSLKLFWHRNFYPDIYTLANDLHNKGLIESGDYLINIDW